LIDAKYYAQQASTPLIIAEGTQPSADGQGYLLTPGVYTVEQIGGWRLAAEAVHEAGGQIFIQSDTPHGRQRSVRQRSRTLRRGPIAEAPDQHFIRTFSITSAKEQLSE
jgi:2,4-dienoyl-CoA reductase-like NADH-dependent reductase (Old Yellow Enzyme family)